MSTSRVRPLPGSTYAYRASVDLSEAMDGLIVRQPFAVQIANGTKTWELRLRPLNLKGRFYIPAASRPSREAGGYPPGRLGVAVATAVQVRRLGPLTIGQLARYTSRHRSSRAQLERYARGRPLFALELAQTFQ